MDLNGDNLYGPVTNNASTLITTSSNSSNIDNITGTNSLSSNITASETISDNLINYSQSPDVTTNSFDQGNELNAAGASSIDTTNNQIITQNLLTTPKPTNENTENNLPIEPIKQDTVLI